MTDIEFGLAISGRATWINRHRPLLSNFQMALFFIGATFWVGSIHDPEVFNKATWGELAYFIPAECWAMANMLCSAVIYVGLIRPIKRRLVFWGAVGNIAQYLILAVSAVAFGGEMAIGIYAGFIFLPLFVRLAWEAWNDARRAVD